MFLVSFAENPPKSLLTENIGDNEPFTLVEPGSTTRTSTLTRTGQQRFKFQVLQRYGPQCGVCGIDLPEVLDAAHIRPKRKNGSDDPRNGLVLCASHHRAMDSALFGIEPQSLDIHYTATGPNAKDLRISYSSLEHLHRKPHSEALEWKWQEWKEE